DGPRAFIQPVDVFLHLKDFAAVAANAFEDAVPVQEAVVVNTDLRVFFFVERAVDVNLHGASPDVTQATPSPAGEKVGVCQPSVGFSNSRRPSTMRTMRSASAAISVLCVTITIVSPSSRFKSCKSFTISAPVPASRLPVGSSARRTWGR